MESRKDPRSQKRQGANRKDDSKFNKRSSGERGGIGEPIILRRTIASVYVYLGRKPFAKRLGGVVGGRYKGHPGKWEVTLVRKNFAKLEFEGGALRVGGREGF